MKTPHFVILGIMLVAGAVLLARSSTNSTERVVSQEAVAKAQPEAPQAEPEAGTQAPNEGSSSALEIIHSRKSVRNYTDADVSREDLETVVKAGMAAPTAGNRQPWSFLVVTERESLDKLAEELPHGKMLKQAKAAIVVAGVPEWGFQGEANAYWIQDCSAATQNILLAIEALGLGAVWIGVHPREEREKGVRQALGIPENIIPLAVLSVGYPTGEDKPKDKFKPERIHWERWNQEQFSQK